MPSSRRILEFYSFKSHLETTKARKSNFTENEKLLLAQTRISHGLLLAFGKFFKSLLPKCFLALKFRF